MGLNVHSILLRLIRDGGGGEGMGGWVPMSYHLTRFNVTTRMSVH